MTKRGSAITTITAGVLGGAMLATVSSPALANPEGVEISANVALTTDYVFRGISQTLNDPAIQGAIDLTYKHFYAGVWASNVDFGAGSNSGGNLETIADLEIDYYAGITPSWKHVDFDFAVLYYTYPGACDECLGLGELDYVEFKAGASTKIQEKLGLGFATYYSPDNFGETGENWVFEFSADYELNKFWCFTPTISGLIGFQEGDEDDGGFDYTYWNAGVTLAFWEKPSLSIDVRYWDTDATALGVFADERVVATLKAEF